MTTPVRGAAERHRTADGLRVVVVPMPHAHRVAIDAHLFVGPRWEQRADRGLSHFLEHMIYRGTPRSPTAHEQALGFERLGGTLAAATYVDHGNLELSVPKATLRDVLPLLGEAYREPLFTGIDVERGIVREEILELYDEGGVLVDADDLLRAEVFHEHPIGMPITGTLEDLEGFDIERLRQHHARHYTSDQTVIAIAGPVDPGEVHALVERAFAGLPRGVTLPAERPSAQTALRRKHVSHAASQTELRLGFRAPGERDVGEPATELLLRVLDDGMSTRLYHRICDERGLCYDVSATYEAYADVGIFDVAAESAHERAVEVFETALDLLEELREHGPTQAELDKAKARFAWQLDELHDDPGEMAAFVALAELSGSAQTPAERLEQLHAVSRDAVRDAAAAVFRAAGASVITVGKLRVPALKLIEHRLARF